MKNILACLGIALLSAHGAAAQSLQTVRYPDGSKAMEGRWRYDNNAHTAVNLVHTALMQELAKDAFQERRDRSGIAGLYQSLHCKGPVTTWYKDGGKKAEIFFRDGAATGPYKEYYRNGKIAMEGRLDGGIPDGPWTYYERSGAVMMTGKYKTLSQEARAALWQQAFLQMQRYAERDVNTMDMFELSSRYNAPDSLKAISEVLSLFRNFDGRTQTDGVRTGTFSFPGTEGNNAELRYTENIPDGTWTYSPVKGKPPVKIVFDKGRIVGLTDPQGVSTTVAKMLDAWEERESTRRNRYPNAAVAGDPNGVAMPPVEAPGPEDPNKVFRFIEQQPDFSGNLTEYLTKQIRYPDSAKARGEQGRVFVEFVVRSDGRIDNVRIARSSGFPALDAEALRVVQSMPPWKPGRQNGRPVNSYFTMPVSFRLE